MSYMRVNWNSTTTFVSAENLNVMDKGIKDLDTNMGDVAALKTSAKTIVPAINEINNNLGKNWTKTARNTTLQSGVKKALTENMYLDAGIYFVTGRISKDITQETAFVLDIDVNETSAVVPSFSDLSISGVIELTVSSTVYMAITSYAPNDYDITTSIGGTCLTAVRLK